MTTRTDYTEEQWDTIASSIPNVATAVMMSDQSSIEEVVGEATIISERLQETYHTNELVRSCLEWLGKDWQMAEAKENVEDILSMLTEAQHLVSSKAAAEETLGFKQFLYDLAEKTAQAYAEKSDKAVSDAEAATLQRIKAALEL
jgi:hypothetical protein